MLSESSLEIKFLFSLIVPFFSEIEAALVFIGLRTILIFSPSGMTSSFFNSFRRALNVLTRAKRRSVAAKMWRVVLTKNRKFFPD